MNDFNSEGTKNATRLEAIEDNIIHSDPGVDSVLSERISRKVTKRKPKRKEDFKDGKIRRWNEFVILRGKNEGNAGNSKDEVGSCVWNKKFDWKVYTRRSKNREKVSGKRKVGKRSIENFVHVDWQGIEQQHLDSSQCTDNSSSENLESDNEVFEIEDMDSEKEREEGEEAGFEGMRCLLGLQVSEHNVQSTNDGDMVDKPKALGNPIELTENEDKRSLGLQRLKRDEQPVKDGNMTDTTEALPQHLKIGKFGVTREEMKNAAGTLNIELIEKDAIDVTNLAEDKGEVLQGERGLKRSFTI